MNGTDVDESDTIPYSQKYLGFVALRGALFNREFDEAARLIAADPSVLEARNGLGETTLHFLAVENAQDTVAFLIQRGANVNTVNDFGDTPLMDAASLNYAELCRFLMQHEADPFYELLLKQVFDVDDDRRQQYESEVVCGLALVADRQPPEVVQPRKITLYAPASPLPP